MVKTNNGVKKLKFISELTQCLDCKNRTRMIQFLTPWYGWDSTCIRCGRRWQDGEWMALPFIPKSREISVSSAKKRWRLLA